MRIRAIHPACCRMRITRMARAARDAGNAAIELSAMTTSAIFGSIVLLREHLAVKVFGGANEPTFAVNTDVILRRSGRGFRLAARLQ